MKAKAKFLSFAVITGLIVAFGPLRIVAQQKGPEPGGQAGTEGKKKNEGKKKKKKSDEPRKE